MILPPDEAIRCSECQRDVEEFTAIAERWASGATAAASCCPDCASS